MKSWRIKRPIVAAIAAILAAGAIARWSAASLPDAGEQSLTGDERVYWRIAGNLSGHGVFAYETAVPTAFRAPLLPSLVRITQIGADFSDANRTRRGLIALWAIGLPVIFFAAVLGSRGSVVAGLVAAVLCAFHPSLLSDAMNIRTEALDCVTLACVCFFGLLWLGKPRKSSAVLLGLAIGTALCARSTLFLTPVFFILAGLFFRLELPKVAAWGPSLVLGVCLPLLPWMARNAFYFGEFIPLERNPAALGFYYASLGLIPPQGLVEYSKIAEEQDPGLARLDSQAQERRLGELTRENILSNPKRYFSSVPVRAAALWGQHSFMLLAAGLSLFFLRRRPEAWLMASLAGYYSVNAFLDLYLVRMHPALVPLSILIALGAAEAVQRSKKSGHWDIPLKSTVPGEKWALGVLASLWLVSTGALLCEIPAAAPARWKRPAGLPEPKVFLDKTVWEARFGRKDSALAALDESARAYPDYAALHVTHGSLLLEAGRGKEAVDAYRRAVELLRPVPTERAALAALERDLLR